MVTFKGPFTLRIDQICSESLGSTNSSVITSYSADAALLSRNERKMPIPRIST